MDISKILNYALLAYGIYLVFQAIMAAAGLVVVGGRFNNPSVIGLGSVGIIIQLIFGGIMVYYARKWLA